VAIIAAHRASHLRLLLSLVLISSASLLSGCELSQTGRAEITVTIATDGKSQQVSVPAGSTVAMALQRAGLTTGSLDRSDPPFYAVLSTGDSIKLTRVEERFRTEIQTIPFERQTVRNESLPEGQQRLVQAGANGEQELTYRTVLEDGVQTSESVVKTVTLKQAVPEIVMVGAQSSFAPLPMPGTLAYLAAGNAWVMDTSTANRRLLVNTGDLDGRVFVLSPDGSKLLFSRKSSKPADQQINTLWVVSTTAPNPSPISLNATNVVHFAAWYPGSSTAIAYSTVEPRGNAPGWQANNDLFRLTIGGQPQRILDARSGGIYGWWGMSFAFSPDGHLAYAQPDSIGFVSQAGGYLAPLIEITPLQTHSDWAWTPGMAWGGDGQTFYYLDHVPASPPVTDEESPFFDLKAASLVNDATVDLAPQVGMWAYPAASAVRVNGQEKAYQVAFLQAIFPHQSETSRYRLVVMDRDGSNRRVLFPSADLPGLGPQTPTWAPNPIPGQSGDFVGVVYQGNLWLIDSGGGQAYQVTGDGLISEIDWK
jgi:hypothetical protein